MIVLVCGSRNWTDKDTLNARLDQLSKHDLRIIHGGAKGADKMGYHWAFYHGVKHTEYKPDWEKYGRSAGIKRNIQMLDTSPDLVIAFWDGKSKGTSHTITEARKRGIPTEVIYNESERKPDSAN